MKADKEIIKANKKIEHKKICDGIHEMYVKKNNDYGDSVSETYEKYGIDSFLVRMTDKLNRVYTLTRPGAKSQIADEKIEDTLLDLANYAIIAVTELRSRSESVTSRISVIADGIKVNDILLTSKEEHINNHIPKID